MKVCSKCHIEKEDSCFWKGKGKDGLQSYCKSCAKNVSLIYARLRGVPERKNPQVYNELSATKICTRCQKVLPKDAFRIRYGKGKNSETIYLTPSCMECENQKRKEYYDKIKDDPEFKRKNKERVKEYLNKNVSEIRQRRQRPEYKKKHANWNKNSYHRVKDRVSNRMKAKRQTPEYKKMMREYRQKNKDKIYKQETITKRRHHEKHRDGCTDEYVTRMLISEGVATRETLKQYPEIIEAKRLQILIKRKIKEHEN